MYLHKVNQNCTMIVSVNVGQVIPHILGQAKLIMVRTKTITTCNNNDIAVLKICTCSYEV